MPIKSEVAPEIHPIVLEIRHQYREFQKAVVAGTQKRISLVKELDLSDRAMVTNRNPNSVQVERNVKAWAQAERRRIWLPTHEDSNTMSAYLHINTVKTQIENGEGSFFDRLELATEMYEGLFSIDDTWSNDIIKGASDDTKAERPLVIAALATIPGAIFSGEEVNSEYGIVNAIYDCLKRIKQESDKDGPRGKRWFKRFVKSLGDHLSVATEDKNKDTFDRKGFIDMRNKVSGMFITTDFMEFMTGLYIDWEYEDWEGYSQEYQEDYPSLEPAVLDLCRTLNYEATYIGGFANELFSFEKEVILSEDTFNIVPWTLINELAKNQQHITFIEAIFSCIEDINASYVRLKDAIILLKNHLEITTNIDPKTGGISEYQRTALNAYIAEAETVATASITWEVDTNRYRVNPQLYAEKELQDGEEPLLGIGIFDETDPTKREEDGLNKVLTNGQDYPDDYQDIKARVYQRYQAHG